MIDLTHDAIQLLLDHPKGEGMIVSCYADASVTEGFVSLWSQHLKNEESAIERRLANDHQAQARFATDLAIIRHALEEPVAQRARGVALFSASDRGLFRAFSLGVPVKDRLVLDEAPYLVPLLEAMHRQRRYLLVLTDSHRGRLYEAAWGHTHLLRQIDKDIPRRQKSAGELWGKQQATIARHREDLQLHYRKELARERHCARLGGCAVPRRHPARRSQNDRRASSEIALAIRESRRAHRAAQLGPQGADARCRGAAIARRRVSDA